MNRRLSIMAFFVLSCSLVVPRGSAQDLFPGLGDQRVGISSFTFLKIGVGARAVAMGEAYGAIANDATALYWNPAAVVISETDQVVVAHTEWFADIRHEFGGVLYHLTPEDAVGISFITLTTDDMPRTTTLMPMGTGEMFRFQDLSVGLTYSRKMTNQFSFGVTARYIREQIAELSMQNIVVDVGAYYLTGFSTTRFAIVLSSFGSATRPEGSIVVDGVGDISQFEEFSPPTQFRLAFAMEPILLESHRLTTSFQLNHPNDNAENIGIGLEYGWNETVFLRLGYRINVDEQRLPSLGFGLQVPVEFSTLQFDYAVSSYHLLGMAHRFTLGASF